MKDEQKIAQENSLKKDKYPLAEYSAIGKRGVWRKDGYEKASGYAVYTSDVQLPGMLYLRTLSSPYPHARIISMDTSRAEALPGVQAILRYDDPELPEKADTSGHFGDEEPVLNRVAYWQGMLLGVSVAADTEDIANEALKLVKVEWEERPFNLDQEEALRPGAPLSNPESHPDGNLIPPFMHDFEVSHGDVAEGFKEADQIIEFKVRRDRETYVSPERPCGVFRWNGEYPELWVKHQRPHLTKRQIAQYFKLPVSKVQLHCLYQGATFGGWSQNAWMMGSNYIAGILSRRTGRPVKWIFTRREDFYGGGMDDCRYEIKVGTKNDGTITAVHAKTTFSDRGLSHTDHFIENTKIPNLYQGSRGAVLNIMRGHAIRCEQLMNVLCLNSVFGHVAEALKMDPTELAFKNDGCEGQAMADLVSEKQKLGFQDRDSLRECIEAGKKAIDWDNKWHAPGTKKLPNGKLHGLGFAWSHEWSDSAGAGSLGIRLERDDGSARIFGMRCDCGVSAETSYCQIVADELGLRYEDVEYRPFEESGFIPMTPDSSTNLTINGFAVRNAARKLKQKILKAATSLRISDERDSGYVPPFADYKPEDLEIKDGIIYVKADPLKKMTIAEFVGPSHNMGKMTVGSSEPFFAYGWHMQQGMYDGPPGPRQIFVRQTHFVEVEVDSETGEVEVTRVVNCNDVGKVINPDACEGQQYGGTFMGVSRVTSEEVVYCPETGVVLNGNLLDYKISTILDVGPIDTILIETGMGYGPYGSTGIGECVPTVVPSALYAAVHNAIGQWVDMPLTPQRVLKALGKI